MAADISGMPVLVTGASGFIGGHLCRRLSECGARVHAVSRQPRDPLAGGGRWLQLDLRDLGAVREAVRAVEPQIVFHLASQVTGARDLGAVVPTFYDNLASTVHLLTAAAETGGPRVVVANSSEEPTAIGRDIFPCSPYAAAKSASSLYGRMFHHLFALPVVMPRIFMTYGPDQKDKQKLVPFVIERLLRGEAPKLSSGRRQADWIYVGDVVEGLLGAAVTPGIEGRVFDLGTGVLTSVRQVVEQIVAILGSPLEPAFGALPDRPFEQERPADTAFLADALAFRAETSLKEGLEATVAWYRRQMTPAVSA